MVPQEVYPCYEELTAAVHRAQEERLVLATPDGNLAASMP
jgi:hypothetical protein